MKKIRDRKIIQDIWQYKWLILTVAAVLVGMNLLFRTTCPSVLLFGLPCPGCGITRAFLLLLTGHPVQAFWMNPSVYAWIGLGGYIGFYRYILERKVPRLSAALAVTVIAVFVIYGVCMWKYFPNREPFTVKSDSLLEQILPYYSVFLKKF